MYQPIRERRLRTWPEVRNRIMSAGDRRMARVRECLIAAAPDPNIVEREGAITPELQQLWWDLYYGLRTY